MKQLSFKEQIIISAISILLYTCIHITFTCFITNNFMVVFLSLITFIIRYCLLIRSVFLKSNNKFFISLSFIFTICFAILYFKTINIIYIYIFLEVIPMISLIYILNKHKPIQLKKFLKYYSNKNVSMNIYISSKSFLQYYCKNKIIFEQLSKTNTINIFISTTFNDCDIIDEYIDHENIIVTITNYKMHKNADKIVITNNINQYKTFIYRNDLLL